MEPLEDDADSVGEMSNASLPNNQDEDAGNSMEDSGDENENSAMMETSLADESASAAGPDQKKSKTSDDADADDEADASKEKAAASTADHSGLGTASPAVKAFLKGRLEERVCSYVQKYHSEKEGAVAAAEAYVKECDVAVSKTMGHLHGTIGVSYIYQAKSGQPKTMKSMWDIIVACRIETQKVFKILHRDIQANFAAEYMDKSVLSHMLGVSDGRADEITLNDLNEKDGYVNILVRSSESQLEHLKKLKEENRAQFDAIYTSEEQVMKFESKHHSARPLQNITYSSDAIMNRFSFGSSTVMNWGRVIPHIPLFHKAHHVFPLGFQCLRLEHDVILDQVVECLCEIHAILPSGKPSKIQNQLALTDPADLNEEEKEIQINLVPLFRLTVGWVVGPKDNKKEVRRVYDGNSPAIAWQAAMLERTGLDEDTQVENMEGKVDSTVINRGLESGEMEEEDEEEMALRIEVTEKRRLFFRALRDQQNKCNAAPVESRITLNNVETFLDEGIQRTLEGFVRVKDCVNYEYIGSRESDGGKRLMEKSFSKQHVKGTLLTKVITQNGMKLLPKPGLKSAKSSGKKSVSAAGNKNKDTDEKGTGKGQLLVNGKRRRRKRDANGNLVDLPPITDRDKIEYAISNNSKINVDDIITLQLYKERKALAMRKKKDARDDQSNDISYLREKMDGTLLNVAVEGAGTSSNSVTANAADKEISLEQKAKLKDVERNIRNHVSNFYGKIIRKRQIDAKAAALAMCEREESIYKAQLDPSSGIFKANVPMSIQDCSSVPDRGDRPDPLHGLVKIHGGVFTQLLELWEFLTTFHKQFNLSMIPTLETVISALKICDPSFEAHQSKSIFPLSPSEGNIPGVKSDKINEYAQASHKLSPRDATDVLNKLGMLFAQMMCPEYERIMGIDTVKASAGGDNETKASSIPVNLLTWREIARTVLLHGMSREVGLSEIDAISFLKGKGYHAVPDLNDKKVPKLIRRRILAQYSLRHEYQESVVGFSSGIISRIPAPSFLRTDLNLRWRNLLLSLIRISPYDGWRIYEVIESSLHQCDGSNPKIVAQARRQLLSCLSPDIFLRTNASVSKIEALKVLFMDTGFASNESAKGTRGMDIAKRYCDKYCGKDDDIAIASTEFDDEVLNCSIDHSNSSLILSAARSKKAEKQNFLGSMSLRTKLVNLDDEGRVGVRGVGLYQGPLSSSAGASNAVSSAPETIVVAMEEEGEEPNESDEEYTGNGRPKAKKVPEEEEEDDDVIGDNLGADGLPIKLTTRSQQPWRYDPEYHQVLDSQDHDKVYPECISVAMQRCYEIVKGLMRNTNFVLFNYPIDAASMPHYYASIPHPLCLLDIRNHLVDGGYENSISTFYRDTLSIFENAMAFNAENTGINNQAQKCVLIFERLYFEQVITWDTPLQLQDCCHQCRSPTPCDPNQCVTCDRCEANFHLMCVNPPLMRPPKTDYLCTLCITQHGLAETHPNKVALVSHPDVEKYPGMQGTVYGLEQVQQSLKFTVYFADTKQREVWSAPKVRKYSLAYFEYCKAFIAKRDNIPIAAYDDASHPSNKAELAGDEETADPKASFAQLRQCREVWLPELPSGYDIDEYDYICGLVRAYTGWASSHLAIPGYVNDAHSFKSKLKSQMDPYFSRFGTAVSALSGSTSHGNMWVEDWTAILRSLMQRVMASSLINDATTALERELPGAMKDGLRAIRTGTANRDVLIRESVATQGSSVEQNQESTEDKEKSEGQEEGGLGADTNSTGLSRQNSGKELLEAGTSALNAIGEPENQDGKQQMTNIHHSLEEQIFADDSGWDEEACRALLKGGGLDALTLEAESAGKDKDTTAVVDETAIKTEPDTYTDADAIKVKEELGVSVSEDAMVVDTDTNTNVKSEVPVPSEESVLSHHLIALLRKLPKDHGAKAATTISIQDAAPGEEDKDKLKEDEKEKEEREKEEAVALEENDAVQVLWELKRLSRYRAKDDALLLQALLTDLLQSIDLDSLDNDVPSSGQPNIYSLLLPQVIKACLPKMSDNIDVEEWSTLMERFVDKFGLAIIETLQGRKNKKMTMEDSFERNWPIGEDQRMCKLCGQNETYLGSLFVHGQTWEEWDASQDEEEKRIYAVANGTAFEHDHRSLCIDQVRFKVTNPVSIATSTVGILDNFLENARTGAQWKVTDQDLLQMEEEEAQSEEKKMAENENENVNAGSIEKCDSSKLSSLHYRIFPPKKGSMICHEYCMAQMSMARENTLGRARKKDTARVLEILTSIGRAKTQSLGVDRSGGRYWVFAGSPFLYVASQPGPSSSLAELAGRIPCNINNSQPSEANSPSNSNGSGSDVVSQTSTNNLAFTAEFFAAVGFTPNCGNTGGSEGLVWTIYRNIQEIGRLVRWLDPIDPRERQVRRILCLLYPEAETLANTPFDEQKADVSDESKSALDWPIVGTAEEQHRDVAGDEMSESEDGDDGASEFTLESEVSGSDTESEEEAELGDEVAPRAIRKKKPALSDNDMMDTESEESEAESKPSKKIYKKSSETKTKTDENANEAYSSGGRRVRSVTSYKDLGEDEEEEATFEGEMVIEQEPLPLAEPNSNSAETKTPSASAVVVKQQNFVQNLQNQNQLIEKPREKKTWDRRRGARNPPIQAGLNKLSTIITVKTKNFISDALLGLGTDFTIGQPVCVQNILNGVFWDAKILAVQNKLFKVRFERWGPRYDSWVPERQVVNRDQEVTISLNRGDRTVKKSSNARQVRNRSRAEYSETEAFTFPDPISTLNACAKLQEMDEKKQHYNRVNYSDAIPSNPLGMVRAALLTVEAAIPVQAFDESDERWGKTPLFVHAWHEAVAQAKDATDIMGCIIMLEHSVKSAWISAQGIKLQACMPSRGVSMRKATVGLVATRLWAFDAGLKFSKDTLEAGKKKVGRPKKYE